MRKIYLTGTIVLAILMTINWSTASAQCALSGSYWGEMLPNNGCAAFANYAPYGPGQYMRMPILLGGSYSISTCGASIDTQLTGFQGVSTTQVFYSDDNGPDCSGTAASVNYTAAFSDYVRVQISQYNCQPGGSSSITVKVRQNNNINVTTSNTSMCQGQSRTLTATPARVTGTLLAGSGDAGTFSGTGVAGTTFTAPTPSTSSATYTHTYTFGYCTGTRSIDVYRSPTISNAGPDQTICATTATLSGNNPTYGAGTWTIVTGTGTITSASSASTTVTGLTYGSSVTLRWTVINGPCAPSTDDVVITVQPQPTTANAGPDQNVCSTTATLAGNVATVGSGMWTLVGGSGTITNATNPATGISGLGIGANTFRWTITNGGCTASTDDVVITRDGIPTTAIAGPDQSLCDSTTTLLGNAPSVGTGLWTVAAGTANIVTPGSPTSAVNGLAIGNATLVWTISNGACQSSRDTVVILRNAPPALPTVNGSLSVCIGNSTSLVATSGAGSPTFEWYDAPTGGTLLSSSAGYTTPNLSTTTTYYVKVRDGITTCNSARVPVTVTVLALPVVSLGADTTVCGSDTVCLNGGSGFASYTWSNGGTSQTECFSGGGQIILNATDSAGCSGRDTLDIFTNPNPVVNLGPDTSYCENGSVMIGVNPGPGTYTWSNGDSVAMISVNVVGNYTLTCVDTNGCSGTDEITVSENPAPTAAFTQNTSGCPVIAFTDGSSATTSWFWSFGDGTTSTSPNPSHDYQPAGNGTYTITLISTGNCGVDTTTQTVVINCVVANEIAENGPQISVVPNPNNGRFRIEAANLPSETFELTIFNNVGQLVYTWTSVDHSSYIGHDITLDQSAGVYYAKIVIGNEKITRRIILQK